MLYLQGVEKANKASRGTPRCFICLLYALQIKHKNPFFDKEIEIIKRKFIKKMSKLGLVTAKLAGSKPTFDIFLIHFGPKTRKTGLITAN